MRHRRRSKKQPFGWISALIFNSLLLATAYVTGLVIIETRQALGEEFAPTREALDTTRANLGEMFTDLIDPSNNKELKLTDTPSGVQIDNVTTTASPGHTRTSSLTRSSVQGLVQLQYGNPPNHVAEVKEDRML